MSNNDDLEFDPLKKEFGVTKDDDINTIDLQTDFNASVDPQTDFNASVDLQNDFNTSSDLQNLIHIRVQQRNGRKTLTTVQGLPNEYDQKKLLKAFKKEFACNGTLVKDGESGEVIQLQGDQRHKISRFLQEEGISQATLKIHGF